MTGLLTSAGVARVTITPPVGSPLVGFLGRGVSTACHDELTATTLVVSRGESHVAIIACDLLDSTLASDVAARVEEVAGIPAANVLLAASHTHYGPPVESHGWWEDVVGSPGRQLVEAYLANLINALAGGVSAARAGARPCRLGWGVGEARIGVNRRERTPSGIILGENLAGPYDPRVAVVRIDDDQGAPLAAILNCACHPVSLGGACTDISADFPGVARRLAEEETGATWLFLQGATGNVNPVVKGPDWTHPKRLGLPLGAEALRLFWSIEPHELEGEVGVVGSILELAPLLPTSATEVEVRIEALEEQARELDGDRGVRYLRVTRDLKRARSGLRALRGGPQLESQPAHLAAASIGKEIGLASAPGEVFTETGQAIIAESPFPLTLYLGYTNGSVGYLPTREAYAEGGYEVDIACHVAAGSAERLQAESIRLLEALPQ